MGRRGGGGGEVKRWSALVALWEDREEGGGRGGGRWLNLERRIGHIGVILGNIKTSRSRFRPREG